MGGPDGLVSSDRTPPQKMDKYQIKTFIGPHLYYSYIALGTVCRIDLLNPTCGRQTALEKYRLVPCKEPKLVFSIHTDNRHFGVLVK